MKIQQVKINFVRLPLEEPLVGAPPMPGMLREFFTVQILTDDGIEGIGITTFGGKLIRTLKTALDEFGELIKGEDPLRTEQVVAKLRAASAPCGPGGVVGHPRQGIWRSAGAVARRPARPCACLLYTISEPTRL